MSEEAILAERNRLKLALLQIKGILNEKISSDDKIKKIKPLTEE
jgi:hypothetical protein